MKNQINILKKDPNIEENKESMNKRNNRMEHKKNPHTDLLALFDPPTKLSIKCLIDDERSFIEDRRFVGKRAAEIVEKKYGGYNKVSNEQLSLANKQAWEERISFCKAFHKKKNNKTLRNESEGQNKNI